MTTVTYYEDLSEYAYPGPAGRRPGTKNVGWLGDGHAFNTAVPSERILDRLWSYCKVSVAATRGFHECEFCPGANVSRADRNGESLLLGTSEIRVLSAAGDIYAAPTLIYHYMVAHQYAPPVEFLRAIEAGPAPPDPEYFHWLEQLGLTWNATSAPGGPPRKLWV